ncbi:MAG: hypothetical protein WBD07_13260 [Vicinamibacterales bacterium]
MRRRVPAILALIVCTLLAAPAAQVPASLRIITLPESHQLSLMGWRAMAMAPGGTRFVYAANGRLYLQAVAGGQPTEIPGTAIPPGVMAPVFSPDGRSLAFWSAGDSTLRRIAVGGGTPAIISQADNPAGMTWGSDNQIVFGQSAKGIMRVSANGGTPETIVAPRGSEMLFGPQMLPGSDAVLFTALLPRNGAPGFDKTEIVVQSLGSGIRKTLIDALSEAQYVPTGHLVYTVDGALMAVAFDAARLETRGRPVTILQAVRSGGAAAQFGFSESGSLAYVAGRRGQRQVALVDRTGRRQPLGFLPETVFAPRLSPDGRQLTVDDQGSIWVADLANLSMLRPVVASGPTTGVNQFPLWSADGERLFFISNRDGGVQALYSQRADGTGDAELLVKPARSGESWSATGDRLTYITLKGTSDYDVWSYSIRDKTAAPLIETADTAQLSSKFSHDGRWVAYQSNESSRFEIYVQPVPTTGAKFPITKDGGTLPVWSPDDRELLYVSGGRLHAVPVQMRLTPATVTAGTPVPLPITDFIQQGTIYARRQYDMTPDGKQFLVMYAQAPQVEVVVDWFDDLKRRVPVQ